MTGCTRNLSAFLLLIAAVTAIGGWALDATGTTVMWGSPASWTGPERDAVRDFVSGRDDRAVGMSACFVVPLWIVTFVAGINLLVWLVAGQKNRRPEKNAQAGGVETPREAAVDDDLRQSPR